MGIHTVGVICFISGFSVAAVAQDQDLSALSLQELAKVEVLTASMHSQSQATAPSLVTVISSDEIARFGYRTLAEALNHVPGIYTAYDYTYYTAGVAGFSVPGDWSTRILLLINGHSLIDNIFGSADFFGDDFVLDMSLVRRIEIVRGPSSALYGSNGILATVNVITRTAAKEQGLSFEVESDSLGEKQGTVSGSVHLRGAGAVLLSATIFNTSGQENIDVLSSNPAIAAARANHMDGSRGYRLFADWKHGNWEIMSLAGSREKIQPVSWSETIFNDRGTRATDMRGFVDALYTRNMNSGGTLRWRIYYDRYQYRGEYRYPLDGTAIDVNREFDAGDWAGSQLSYRFDAFRGFLTAGSELKFDLRALQSAADIAPVYTQNLYLNKLDRFAAGFVQQEWTLGRKWSFNFGARYDWSYYRSSSFSPRAAAVYQPDSRTSLKLLYGRGFRNPNANEMFFNDGKQNEGNLALLPEFADTFQIVAERRILRSWRAALSTYHVSERRVIIPDYTEDGLIQFQNASRFTGYGAGAELSGHLFSWLDMSANFQKQKAFLSEQTPANSPGNLGRVQFSTSSKLSRTVLSGGFLYTSARKTLAGATLDPVYLADVTLTRKMPGNFDFRFGVRNLTNVRYSDPIGLRDGIDALPQAGRTLFFTAVSHLHLRN